MQDRGRELDRPVGLEVTEEPAQVALLEDPHHRAERGGEAEQVQQHGLDAGQHAAGNRNSSTMWTPRRSPAPRAGPARGSPGCRRGAQRRRPRARAPAPRSTGRPTRPPPPAGPGGLPARSTLSQDARGPSKPLEAAEAGATSTPWENVPAAVLTVETPATRETAAAYVAGLVVVRLTCPATRRTWRRSTASRTRSSAAARPGGSRCCGAGSTRRAARSAPRETVSRAREGR